ncbi:MAG: prepilin peptidase [Rickettsiales bacterium]
MFLIGACVGNFATSLVYRLPRNLKIANDPPYCDHCHAYLEERDKFPIFSWLFNKGKCRKCGVAVPSIYTWIEIASGIVFMAAWWRFGVSEQMLLYMALGECWIVLASIAFNGVRLPAIMLVATAGVTAVFRTLQEGTMHGFIVSSYLFLMVGVILWLGSKRKLAIANYAVPLSIAGMAVPMPVFHYAAAAILVVWIGLRVIEEFRPMAFTAACASTALLFTLL